MWAGRAVLVASLIGFCSCATQDTAVKTPAAPQSGLAKGVSAEEDTKVASQDIPEKPDLAVWAKATNLFETGKYDECIAFCRENASVETLFLIADCYAKLRQMENAVQQLREIESFYPKHAPRAVRMIMELYRKMGNEVLWIAAARDLLRKYPGSPEAKEVERELK